MRRSWRKIQSVVLRALRVNDLSRVRKILYEFNASDFGFKEGTDKAEDWTNLLLELILIRLTSRKRCFRMVPT